MTSRDFALDQACHVALAKVHICGCFIGKLVEVGLRKSELCEDVSVTLT